MLLAAPAAAQESPAAAPASSPAPNACAAPENGAPALTVEEIVARLQEANARRGALLQSYTATRSYHAENARWKKSAEMEATVKFSSPATSPSTGRASRMKCWCV